LINVFGRYFDILRDAVTMFGDYRDVMLYCYRVILSARVSPELSWSTWYCAWDVFKYQFSALALQPKVLPVVLVQVPVLGDQEMRFKLQYQC